MSRYPWRDTSTDIAGGQPPQWETPQGAQAKADEALKDSKEYTDQQNTEFTEHIENTTIHVTAADKTNWNSKAPGVHTHANATSTTPGFMSAEDKAKLNNVEAEANNYVHPATHPPAIIAQDADNRFVSDAEKATWNNKAASTEATTAVKGLMSPTDKQKLNGIQAEAEVNQNAFSGVNDVSATSKTDTLQLTGGTGITITTNPTNKQVTITATGDATPGAHASSHITGGTDVIPDAVVSGNSGLMSGADAKFVRQDGESKTGAQTKADAALVAANEYTDGKVAEIVIDNASLTQKGIVQLSNATGSSSETEAATPKAVNAVSIAASTDASTKAANAQAGAKTYTDGLVGTLSNLQTTAKGNTVAAINELFTSVGNGKTAVAAAITGKGVAASGSDTFAQLATKIGQIPTGLRSAEGTGTTTENSITVRGLAFQPKLVFLSILSPKPGDGAAVWSSGFKIYSEYGNVGSGLTSMFRFLYGVLADNGNPLTQNTDAWTLYADGFRAIFATSFSGNTGLTYKYIAIG